MRDKAGCIGAGIEKEGCLHREHQELVFFIKLKLGVDTPTENNHAQRMKKRFGTNLRLILIQKNVEVTPDHMKNQGFILICFFVILAQCLWWRTRYRLGATIQGIHLSISYPGKQFLP